MIATDGGGRDLATGVGDQLRTGSGQLTNVGAHGIEHRGHGLVPDLDLETAEFTADEVHPLTELGDLGARVDLGTECLQLIGQRLGPTAARVHDDQHGARLEVCRRVSDQSHRILACLSSCLEHHDAFIGEQ